MKTNEIHVEQRLDAMFINHVELELELKEKKNRRKMTTSLLQNEVSTNILVLTNIFFPVIDEISSNKDLRQIFYQLEEIYPGFARRFLQKFLENEKLSIDFNELTLKMEKFCDKTAFFISTTTRREAEFVELNIRSKNLKFVLSRIPDVIQDKREFLETIKEIASAIKKTLDSVTNIYPYLMTNEATTTVDMEKKEFIRTSKIFSNTLKAFFRDNQRDEVFHSANNLLVQTDYLLRTIRIHCEENSSLDETFYPLRCQFEKENHSNRLSTTSSNHHRTG